ncbi:alanine--glyoxylate aminotransferase family protein [Candidatus Bathyarchaeota archaeon]|nr:alanine--glyoxylate aminotransferase family protein [Candidatus Bathyarchaeota archaeon]
MKGKKHLIMLPGPTNIPDQVMRAMIKPIINHRGPEFHALYERVTENLKYVFQTRDDVFILTSSSTGGIECAISNVVNSGDKVIVPVFGVFSERLKDKVIRRGGEVIELPVEFGKAPIVEDLKQIVDLEKNVKAIALVYNETSTGVTVRDLPKIGKVAREKGIMLIVDAVSILGGDYLPVDEWGVDLCVAGSQKCLACPPGLAVISVSKRAWETIEDTTAKPYYFDLINFRESSKRRENPTTPSLPLFYALDETLTLLHEEGLENRFKRHEKCARAFYSAIKALRLMPFPKEKFRSNTIIAIDVPAGVDNTEVRKIMKEKYWVIVAGGHEKLKQSLLRIGCMGIISEKETLLTISALENALNDVNYPVEIGAGMAEAQQIFHL